MLYSPNNGVTINDVTLRLLNNFTLMLEDVAAEVPSATYQAKSRTVFDAPQNGLNNNIYKKMGELVANFFT